MSRAKPKPTPPSPQQPLLYGQHIPYDKGYDATAFANIPTADDQGASGYLVRPNGESLGLWITEIRADFSASGSTGQSRMLREFFPRSFQDVTLMITGNVASTTEYNRLAMFIREHHWLALQYINSGGSADQTLQLVLNSTYQLDGNSLTPAATPRATKGPHRPWVVSGFVQSIAAGAVRQSEQVAPEFSFGFIVCDSTLNGTTGIWGDVLDDGSNLVLKPFNDIFKQSSSSGFVTDPTVPPKSVVGGSVLAGALGAAAADLGWSTQSAKSFLQQGLFG